MISQQHRQDGQMLQPRSHRRCCNVRVAQGTLKDVAQAVCNAGHKKRGMHSQGIADGYVRDPIGRIIAEDEIVRGANTTKRHSTVAPA